MSEITVLPGQLAEVVIRGVLEHAPDGIIVINADGVILLANAHVMELFGYSRRELVGANIEVLVPEAQRIGHVTDRNRYFAGPKKRPMGFGLRINGRRKNGDTIPVEISLGPIETDTGILAVAFIREDLGRYRRDFDDRNQAAEKAGA